MIDDAVRALPRSDALGRFPLTGRFLMGRGRERLSIEEQRILEDAVQTVKDFPARQHLVRRGERLEQSMLLVDGYITRYMDDREGYRQLVSVHVPGDFVDLHGFPTGRLDHDIGTLGPVKVALYDHQTLTAITDRHTHLTRVLWFSTLLDAAMHREWVFRLGRLEADGRVAHLFCELHARLAMVDLVRDGIFRFPVTQIDIAEAAGVTPVHLNRVLRSLRERGLMTFRAGEVHILDIAALTALADFDPGYLYGGGPTLDGAKP